MRHQDVSDRLVAFDGRTWYATWGKRAFDIAGGVALLPVLAAVSLVVVPVILGTSGRPVLYRAERRGLNGRSFMLLKFRSMVVDAPDVRNADGTTYSAPNDPRVTRVGRLLRRSSLDELPQILNIIKGDMSFVGPRPNLATRPLDALRGDELVRLRVRPGLTGVSQAYFRNGIAVEEKYRHDCEYVESLSLALDLKVVLRTVKTVLTAENVDAVS